jgi:ketosteroid isomerase-like protein
MAAEEQSQALCRTVIEAFNEGDWETWESLWHVDGDWHEPPEAPGAGSHHGVAAIRRYFDGLIELGVDGWFVEIDSMTSYGPDRVLIAARSVLTARGSGIPFEDEIFQVVDLEDGRVRSVRNFRTSEEAVDVARGYEPHG